MAKLILESKTNSFIVNGLEFQKGSLLVNHSTNGVSINGLYADVTDITIDGNVPASISALKAWVSNNLFKSGGGDGLNGVILTKRQLVVNNTDNPSVGVAGLLTPDHWSEFPGGAPSSGQWIAAAQFDTEDQPSMGFVEVSTLETPINESEGMIPFYTQGGQLRVGMPLFPENAVPLFYLDTQVAASSLNMTIAGMPFPVLPPNPVPIDGSDTVLSALMKLQDQINAL